MITELETYDSDEHGAMIQSLYDIHSFDGHSNDFDEVTNVHDLYLDATIVMEECE